MEQPKINQNLLTEKVVQVIEEKENLVRDTVDKKKMVVVFGLKEEHIPVLSEREKEKQCAEELIETIQEDRGIGRD